ncbi:hypothetical protein DFA_10553 [Cavenderia fasciculata]|uniref:Uncharacterized protein n=1 Tax=Cavenderia fasciculata TaxID=261658 RepID=F4QAJ2_CACFS|nr:uncharacterized protein DFA_10553 [Cavenderia fasciculata]EGG15711.1 hypothetical protein DFA_10553 [Cavenderia fasciculata]|eukprot:XP_004354453.1 hypothetical protein DFA_10553 [Cavenderia fasciculata]
MSMNNQVVVSASLLYYLYKVNMYTTRDQYLDIKQQTGAFYGDPTLFQQNRKGFTDAFASNTFIKTLKTNYTFFQLDSVSTNIFSQSLEKLEIIQFSWYPFDYCQLTIESLLEMIRTNSHKNLKKLSLTWVGKNKDLENSFINAMTLNTTIDKLCLKESNSSFIKPIFKFIRGKGWLSINPNDCRPLHTL